MLIPIVQEVRTDTEKYPLGNQSDEGVAWNAAWGVATGPFSPYLAGMGPFMTASWAAGMEMLGVAAGIMVAQE